MKRRIHDITAILWAAIRPRSWGKDVAAAKKLIPAAFTRDFPERTLLEVTFRHAAGDCLFLNAHYLEAKYDSDEVVVMGIPPHVVYAVNVQTSTAEPIGDEASIRADCERVNATLRSECPGWKVRNLTLVDGTRERSVFLVDYSLRETKHRPSVLQRAFVTHHDVPTVCELHNEDGAQYFRCIK